jgi:hypothetical protein
MEVRRAESTPLLLHQQEARQEPRRTRARADRHLPEPTRHRGASPARLRARRGLDQQSSSRRTAGGPDAAHPWRHRRVSPRGRDRHDDEVARERRVPRQSQAPASRIHGPRGRAPRGVGALLSGAGACA